MKSLGIIGSDNSHSSSIAKVCNVKKSVSLRVTHIAGESRASAEKSAAAGAIPHIVDHWQELAGLVDVVMIDHRHGKDHEEPARYFLERGIPTFIDKPLTTELASARALLALAAEKRTPVCSFGLIPLQARFRKFLAAVQGDGLIRAVNTTGPADLVSPNGGIFFYGFHQVDAIVELLGTEAESAYLLENQGNGVGVIRFSGGRLATINCLQGEAVFHWTACTAQGVHALTNRYDRAVYLPSSRILARFAQTGVSPWSTSRMLAPIAILEALEKSRRSGHPENVERV
ncbi:MAG TPA: Gfo/Idh/MocA family oxidoreductase [Terrimicrobiaceae bacterium]|nr:Gfo/Idh/MocA family oxidoreductase [Terrimicrobiaceae bacterium]